MFLKFTRSVTASEAAINEAVDAICELVKLPHSPTVCCGQVPGGARRVVHV